MGEEFALGFKEIFQCVVMGKDIPDSRFNAWEALSQVIGILPQHNWKLISMEHAIGSRPNPDYLEDGSQGPEEIPCVMTQAVWIFNHESDGGTSVESLLPPDDKPNDSEGNKIPEPEKTLKIA